MDADLKAQLLKGTRVVSFCHLNDTGLKMWCFGCGRGRIFLYHAHTGISWCSCLPTLVSAELLPTGGLSHETGIPCSPWVLPSHLTQARVPGLPLDPSLCCRASSHTRESPSALPPACGKPLLMCRPLPRLRGLSCPFLKQVLECLQRCSCVQGPAFP